MSATIREALKNLLEATPTPLHNERQVEAFLNASHALKHDPPNESSQVSALIVACELLLGRLDEDEDDNAAWIGDTARAAIAKARG